MSKVQALIEKIEKRLTDMAPEDYRSLSNKMTLDSDEHAKCQELKSLFFASGKLSLDDAQLLYVILGQTKSHFESRPLAERVATIKIYSEMLEMKVSGKI